MTLLQSHRAKHNWVSANSPGISHVFHPSSRVGIVRFVHEEVKTAYRVYVSLSDEASKLAAVDRKVIHHVVLGLSNRHPPFPMDTWDTYLTSYVFRETVRARHATREYTLVLHYHQRTVGASQFNNATHAGVFPGVVGINRNLRRIEPSSLACSREPGYVCFSRKADEGSPKRTCC